MDLVMHPVGQCQESGHEHAADIAIVVDGLIATVCFDVAREAADDGLGNLLLTPLGRPPGQDVRRVAAWLRRRRDDLPDSLTTAQRTLLRLVFLRLAERLDRNDTGDTPVAAA